MVKEGVLSAWSGNGQSPTHRSPTRRRLPGLHKRSARSIVDTFALASSMTRRPLTPRYLRLMRVGGLLYTTVDPVTFDSFRVTSPPMAAAAFLLPVTRIHPAVQLVPMEPDGSARTRRP